MNPSQYKISEVISIVSHQLKTPLSIIKGYLEVLISEDVGKINFKQKDYLGDALLNVQRMVDLVKNLLDVSRIEEGRMEFKLEPSNLEKIVKEIIQEFNPLARAKNCAISFKVNGEIPLLNIDRLKIKQVISNLVANAINYNERRGMVKITLQRKGNNVYFHCQDFGIGIPEKEKNKVFKKFYRSEKAMNLSTEGSGLGLFISKAIIDKSGGKIWFKSQKAKGTTFCFSLPVKTI